MRPRPRFGGAVIGLVMVVAGVAGTWLSWRFFVQTTTGQRLDDTAYRGSTIGRSTLWQAAEPVLDVVSVPFVVLVIGSTAVIAVARGRWFLAAQVAVLVGGANLTTQLLKQVVLDRPTLDADIGSAPNSLPSGHTTVALSTAAALLLVVPRRIRPVVAVMGAGYAAITGISTMIGGWHRPADVVAAVTVVLAWTGLTTVLTALASPERRAASDHGGSSPTAIVSGLLVLVAAGAGVIAASALVRTRELLADTAVITDRTDLATAYVGAALGVVAIVALLFAAILVSHHIACRPQRSAAEPRQYGRRAAEGPASPIW